MVNEINEQAGVSAVFKNDPSSQAAPGALRMAEIDGYRVQWKNDGVDYPAIWAAFRRGELSAKPIAVNRRFRATHLLELNGRKYLMKRDWHVETRPEKRLVYFLMGSTTRYSRIIQLVNRAVRSGCRSAQDIFLVAEKMDGRTCLEAWLIADFMPGRPLTRGEIEQNPDELIATVADIHRHGLACNDIQPYNFIRTDEGEIKGIDMDISSPLWICQANDIWTMKRRFGARVPVTGGLGPHLVWALIGLRDCLRSLSRRLRRKPDHYVRPK